MKQVKVYYSEFEVKKLNHLLSHGVRAGVKGVVRDGNLEQAAEVAWPTGSLDHVSMRMIGIWAYQSVFSDGGIIHQYARWVYMINACCGCFPTSQRARLDRVNPAAGALAPPDPPAPEPQDAGGDAGGDPRGPQPPPEPPEDGPDDGPPPPAPPPEDPEPVADGEVIPFYLDHEHDQTLMGSRVKHRHPCTGCGVIFTHKHLIKDPATSMTYAQVCGVCAQHTPVGMNGTKGKTAEDYEVQTYMTSDHLMPHADDPTTFGPAVIGRDEGDVSPLKPRGVLHGPVTKEVIVHATSGANIRAAVDERITQKQRPCDINAQDRRRIGKLVKQAMGNGKRAIWSVAKIKGWATTNLRWGDIVSGKWSSSRLERSLLELVRKADPTVDCKAAIKAEPMPPGKAPRLLIADGDSGQLMALIVIKCFEELLFEAMESKSIKHRPKRQAINEILAALKKKGAQVVEGDGSAWDTCCSAKLRDCTENPVIYHIGQVLVDFGVAPQKWIDAHEACNTQSQLKLFYKSKYETVRVKIDAIRRSGHRGTSCLNWWMNFVCWTCVVLLRPEEALDVERREFVDNWGHKRWLNFGLEGDDSLLSSKPPLQDHEADIVKTWERFGFNMKLKYCVKSAVFCGVEAEVGPDGPTGLYAPELPRALSNAGVSCSPTLIGAWGEGDKVTYDQIVGCTYISRAEAFAGVLPTVSNMYLRYAEQFAVGALDRETQMRVYGYEGNEDVKGVVESIQSLNLGVSVSQELDYLRRLDHLTTEDELLKVKSIALDRTAIPSVEEYCVLFPKTWL